jgi:hypothetical protein
MQRFKKCIDCMPIEDIPTINDDQLKRMKVLIYNTKEMKDRNEDLIQLIREANLDYARTMNKLVLVQNLKREDKLSQEFSINIVGPLPIDPPKPEVPRYDF